MTSLLTAVKQYDVQKIKNLIKTGSNVNEKDRNGQFPLFIASILAYDDIVELLLDAGANIDETDNNGYTALYIASINGFEDIVKILLDRGANWMIEDKHGENAVSVAAKPKIKKIFIEHEEQKKWEKMLEDENFTQFDELDYEDKDLKNAYNKFKSRVQASMLDQTLQHKFTFLDHETTAELAESLAEILAEGEGKKRRKSIRKKKRRKPRKTNKKK
jgi:ankyrin repeat protein